MISANLRHQQLPKLRQRAHQLQQHDPHVWIKLWAPFKHQLLYSAGEHFLYYSKPLHRACRKRDLSKTCSHPSSSWNKTCARNESHRSPELNICSSSSRANRTFRKVFCQQNFLYIYLKLLSRCHMQTCPEALVSTINPPGLDMLWGHVLATLFITSLLNSLYCQGDKY